MGLWRDLKPAALAAGPPIGAILTLAAGGLLMLSGATPSVPDHFMVVWKHTPPILIEAGHFLSSILGLMLVMLAFGLRARLDAAWAATMVLLLLAAPLALLKGFVWEDAAVILSLAVILAPLRSAFPRKSALTHMEITPGWLASAFAVVVGVGMIGLWSFEHADYGDQPFWKTMADADAARSFRAWGGAAIALMLFGVWRLFATAATPKVVGEGDADFQRVRAILARAEVAEPTSNVALLGDKRFLFSPSGETFLMFAVRSRSWIALGGPVGRRSERLDLLWRFRELADAHAARPGIYAIGVDDLPDVIELGFSVQKIGELATLPLATFQIEGTKRGNLRRAWKKLGAEGATFEVVEPPRVGEIMPDLAAISQSWLANQIGGEKGFSMGGFHPAYVAEFPVAIARWEGRIVAFATLWPTAAKTAFSTDLMRYAEDAPKRIMDFLFVEVINWGRAQGYGAMEFGMAPLAGLEDRRLAPILSRVGNLLFELGEGFYNFQGVRMYKDKYDPVWQPRYIAAPRKWTIPILIADVGLLSSGGVAGLAKRPRKTEEPSGGTTEPPAPA